MLEYKEPLSKRNKAETGIRYEWYAMQRWGGQVLGRISSAVRTRSPSVWQFANISSRFSVDMINASLYPVRTPR